MSSLEVRQKLDLILRWVRSCAICSAWWPPIDFLCETCWRELSHYRLREAQPGYRFKVFALWEWTPKTDKLVRPLIHGFKRGWAVRAAQNFATALLQLHENIADERFWFILPPSSDGSFDHARLLGECLAASFPYAKILILERQKGDHSRQKNKKAAERALFRFQRVEKFSAEGRRIVFVDDLITTGSTAAAAYMALGLSLKESEPFEVWALAVRPKVAGMTGFW